MNNDPRRILRGYSDCSSPCIDLHICWWIRWHFTSTKVEEPTEPEFPVCYECMSGSERTLSCGHVSYHDCLVRTLVSITGDGVITVRVRDTIICPLCRHLTFIKKQADAVEAILLNAKKEETKQGEQTLKVPIPAPPGAFTHYPGALLQSVADVRPRRTSCRPYSI